MAGGSQVRVDPVVESKLSPTQLAEILRLRVYRDDVNVGELATLITDAIFLGTRLSVENLVKAVELLGPFEVDSGKRIWQFTDGVWLPDGLDELTRRVIFCTGHRYRKDYAAQAASVISARKPKINGLGPREFINVKNGMLNWSTLELEPHRPDFYSTYQLKMDWNPTAECPAIDEWMDQTFDPELHPLLHEIAGVTWFPGMGFQKAIVFIGGGKNGKGTFLRLCGAALPASALSAIDPKFLTTNRFMSAELFGKTANLCGDIERATFGMTAEFKKITGDDPLNAERKMGQPFTFTNQATMLFSGNKMPPSRDTSHGWFRRWLIVPMYKQISGPPDPTLETRLHSELEGLLVKAVKGLKTAMENGGFSEPEICARALQDYEFSCNSSALFINEKLEFSKNQKAVLSKNRLVDAYNAFCLERKLEVDSRQQFYKMLETLGSETIEERWIKKGGGENERGYKGVSFRNLSGGLY